MKNYVLDACAFIAFLKNEEGLSTQPIILIYKMDNNFIKHAGFYKVNYKISFADCFVLALATIKKASIISSDHHEFDDIEKSASLQFKWIR